MRTKEMVGAIVALTFFLGIASATAPGAPYEVGGVVYDGGAPVSGDIVVTNLETGNSTSTTTDTNGAYVVSISNIEGGHSAGDRIQVTATYASKTVTSTAVRSTSLSDSPQIINLITNSVTIPANGTATVTSDKTSVTLCTNASVTGDVTITEHTGLPANTTSSSAFGSAVGYVEITVADGIRDTLSWLWINQSYTYPDDLDKNGDGDAIDVGDIQENTLQVLWYNNDTGSWVALATDNPTWVNNAPVRVIHSMVTAPDLPYVAANISHLSAFGLVGIKKPSSSKKSSSSSGGGTYPTPTPTPTVTPTATSDTSAAAAATAAKTVATSPTRSAAAKTAAPAAGDETPTKPKKKGLPGFEGIFAIAGLLAVAYVMMRKRQT